MDQRRADQVGKVAATVKDSAASAIGKAGELAGMAQDSSAAAMEAIGAAASDAGTKVSNLATATYQRSAQTADYLSERTTERPLMALFLAAAVGYAIAYLVHRS